MKRLLFVLTSLIFNIVVVGQLNKFTKPGKHNDGIITMKGDTIACTIVSNPLDVGLKKQWGASKTDFVVALFRPDSVRVLHPGTIHAFYTHENGMASVRPIWYFSDSINRKHDMIFTKPPKMRPVFLKQLINEGFYHLWYFEDADDGPPFDPMFLLEESSTGKRSYFNSNRQLIKLLSDWPGSNKKKYKDRYTGKILMVADYNQYKAGG